MRPVRAIAIYFAFVFLGGALLAPWTFYAAEALASWNSWFDFLAQHSFHRFVNRSLLVVALVGLWPFVRSVSMSDWRELGLREPKRERPKFAIGLMLGFASLAIVAILAIAAGARTTEANHTAAKFMSSLGKAGLGAIAVAIVEEILFRGVLFGALRKAHGWVIALIFSSGLFALVHFFQSKSPQPDSIQWFSGFVTLAEMWRGFAEFNQLVPGFLTLFLVGALLALAYQRTGSLYFSIGLHAGWIFWVKFYTLLTRASSREISWFWGTGKLINGWLAFLVLIVLFAMLFRWRALFGSNQRLI
jgi:uncharacterized protein